MPVPLEQRVKEVGLAVPEGIRVEGKCIREEHGRCQAAFVHGDQGARVVCTWFDGLLIRGGNCLVDPKFPADNMSQLLVSFKKGIDGAKRR